MRSFYSLFKIIMDGKASKRFFVGAVLSFSFSVAVILCTVGLMDGFELTLRSGLKNATGDLVLYNKDTFFNQKKILELIPKQFQTTSVIEVEAFAIFNEMSKGVIAKGIDSKTFTDITKLKVAPKDNRAAIGRELARSMKLKEGDEMVLALSTLRSSDIGGPELVPVMVGEIISHGIYEKDLRFVYLDHHFLRKALSVNDTAANRMLIKLPMEDEKKLDQISDELNEKFPPGYIVEPYWKEFETLLKAVEVEKFSITLILQLIVIVAVFNVIAFIFFINEKKSQDFFLLRAVGLSLKDLIRFWVGMVFLIWAASMMASFVLAKLFDYLLQNLTFLQIPGDVYVLSTLKLSLEISDFMVVYGISLLWILCLCFIGILRLRKKSILSGLRQEFR